YVVLRLRGRDVSYRDVEDRLPVSEAGTRITDMRDCARGFGMDAQVVKATPTALVRCPMPMIAHMEEERKVSGHYVVVVAADGDQVELMDGTAGVPRTVSMTEFGKEWTGYLLLVRPRPWWRSLFWVAAGLGVVVLALAGVLKFARPRRARPAPG